MADMCCEHLEASAFYMFSCFVFLDHFLFNLLLYLIFYFVFLSMFYLWIALVLFGVMLFFFFSVNLNVLNCETLQVSTYWYKTFLK